MRNLVVQMKSLSTDLQAHSQDEFRAMSCRSNFTGYTRYLVDIIKHSQELLDNPHITKYIQDIETCTLRHEELLLRNMNIRANLIVVQNRIQHVTLAPLFGFFTRIKVMHEK